MTDKTDIDKLAALNRIAHAVEAMAKKQDPDFVSFEKSERLKAIAEQAKTSSAAFGGKPQES